MQELPHELQPGVEVQARAARWIVDSLEAGDRATAVDLIGTAPDGPGILRTLLVPFDEVTPLASRPRPCRLREGPGLSGLRALLGASVPWPAPRAAIEASIDLVPHQLSACVALRTDRARRVLIADPVGSGKTIQAGLALADLIDRHPDARALVILPAGLRDQWVDELRRRFSIEARTIDGESWVRDDWLASPDNPWGRPGVLVTSLDYVKRSEVLTSLDQLRWDLVVVDEAHHATPGTDRGTATDALCRRALAVLLLTATPHDGDEGRFRGLCDLGRLDPSEPLLLLRRSHGQLAPRAGRRTRLVRVELSDEESHARRLLARYLRATVEAAGARGGGGVAGLLAAVFAKRATSSPAALESTARRRLALVPAANGLHQPGLPFADTTLPDPADSALTGDADADAILARPGPIAWPKERAWLGAIAEAARRARRTCRKLSILRRVLRRTREPVIVFTEYRDTLGWLLAELRPLGSGCHLHGLQPPSERQRELEAFGQGRARWMLATDVAAEGLNLQQRCRFVIEFDQPWTPLRSEQRIGRVDRIGQRRCVHAWRLSTRDDLDTRQEAAVQGRRERSGAAVARHAATCERIGEAELQCHRALVMARRLLHRMPAPARLAARAMVAGTSPRLVFARPRRMRRLRLPPGDWLAVTEVVVTVAGQTRVESIAVPTVVMRPSPAARLELPALLDRVRTIAARHAAPRVARLAAATRLAHDVDLRRAGLVDGAVRQFVAARFAQPGLFGAPAALRIATSPGAVPLLPVTSRMRPLQPLQVTARVALVVVPRASHARTSR